MKSELAQDCISRQDAIDAVISLCDDCDSDYCGSCRVNYPGEKDARKVLEDLPSAEPERDIPKRVLWTGWKGHRDTRYKCPNCKKPVRNDDVYCHRCGQHLMFPHIDWTPYVKGQKQELIVRWDDE